MILCLLAATCCAAHFRCYVTPGHHGSASAAVITLRLRRGDRLAYRTGPTAGRQTISMQGDPESKTALPSAIGWRQIRFADGGLPAEFTVEIADDGDGWGEWSAVALVEMVAGE